jgi:transposase
MRATTLLRTVLGLKHTRVTGVRFGPKGIRAMVAPRTRRPVCSGCGCRTRRVYDHRRERAWRHLDCAGMETTLVYDLRRLDCPRCGVRAELVPWADAGSRFTRDFEDQVAYFAQVSDRTTVSSTMRIAWKTVGQIIERVVARLGPADRLVGLRHIGIDELSYRRHHEYITIVVDHVARQVVWASEGKNAATVARFFDALGAERAALLETVTMDMSGAYIEAVTRGAPDARIVFDRFHVQRMAQDAVDKVRRDQVRLLEGSEARPTLKKTRWALLKNPWNLNAVEEDKLAEVQRTNRPLYRAYLLKETLAEILGRRQVHVVRNKLRDWISWARRSRLPPFKRLAGTLRRHFEGVLGFVATGLSNGPIEGLNGKVRTITRRAYGFHSAGSLISLIFLCCAGLTLRPVFKTPDPHPLHG